MTDGQQPPPFARRQRVDAPSTPEALFYTLSARPKTHSYLRGPQQDVLRQYAKEAADLPDVALELPTGTGKTLVGLLIADWRRRRSGQKVAYLALTNQLAHQALEEAKQLGIPAADLTGDRERRNPGEVGRYLQAEAVGITTYANLFNAGPVVQASDVLVLDDMHGGDEYVSRRWTVRVGRAEQPDLYAAVLTDVRPGLTSAQLRKVTHAEKSRAVELCDSAAHPECEVALTATLDGCQVPEIRYPWLAIRNHLYACVTLVTPTEIVIRPLVPPTHTHRPFAESAQRIYMSATIEDEDDIRRSYGARTIRTLRAEQQPSGRRFIFAPGMYVSTDAVWSLISKAWTELPDKRAVILAPSFGTADRTFEMLSSKITPAPTKLVAESVATSLLPFTSAENVVLALAARYDGLDLPHDSCRLLMMSESPTALSAFEMYLSENWKFGPVLRGRERTRLIQGLGRCTRDATDYAIVFWIGQSLVDAATNPLVIDDLPADIHAELKWGLEQVGEYRDAPETLAQMIRHILTDSAYRSEADNAIREYARALPTPTPTRRSSTGAAEVRLARSLWDGDFRGAFEQTQEITAALVLPDESGARAWWWMVASALALRENDKQRAIRSLEAALNCRVNAGYVSQKMRAYQNTANEVPTDQADENAEEIWNNLNSIGWSGRRPQTWGTTMIEHLAEDAHTRFHQGLELLGQALGASTTRSTEDGAPDVVWSFGERLHITFEAKTEKGAAGSYSKADLQEANGHSDWVRHHLLGGGDGTILSVIVGRPTAVDPIAVPFVGDLFLLSTDEVREWGGDVVRRLADWRATYFGRDFASCEAEFATAIRVARADVQAVVGRISARRLSAT